MIVSRSIRKESETGAEKMEVGFTFLLRISVLGIALLLLLLVQKWVKYERVRRKLRVQGIKGPPPSVLFPYGNLFQMQKIQSNLHRKSKSNDQIKDTNNIIAHDYTSSLFPYFEYWRKQYGRIYTYSTGMKQHLYVNEAELVKEMNQSMTLELGKPSYLTKRLAPILGNGIIRSNGLFWAQQRKLIAPHFSIDKVKGMVGLMMDSTQTLLRKWEDSIEKQGGLKADIKVDEDLRCNSADVISRACFGSSHFKGKEIFSKLRTLQKLISNQGFLFGLTASGLTRRTKQEEISNLEREVESLIWDAVKERKQECVEKSSSQKDLMNMILEGASDDQCLCKDSSKQFIIDNCKNIYFAGHESTAVAASWCLMLLALHPEWQARIREEIAQVCSDGLPDADSITRLKTVTMVIQESLRLYPPAAFVSREALEETQLGNIIIPKGVCLWTLIPTLHQDPEIWGPDSNEFKPERFSNGVSKACKLPHAYIPFGVGPRLCLGRNFAMIQLKIVLSLIVSKFSFSLSRKYRHSPAYRMIVEPGEGIHILVQKI